MDFRGSLVIAALLGFLWIIVVGLGNALIPLMIAFGLAYLFFPLIQKIEKLGVKRYITVVAVFLFMSLFTILMFVLIVPGLVSDTIAFLQELPQTVADLVDKIENLASDYGYEIQINKDTAKAFIIEHTSQISGTILNGLTGAFKGIFTNAFHWLLAILNIFLIPLFFFYVINDYERISASFKTFIPPSLRPKIDRYLSLTNDVLNGYIRGQFLVAGLLSLLYGSGLALVGLKFGFLIGFVAGWLSIIPYVGFTLGFVTSLIVGFANYSGMGQIIGIVVVLLSVQTVESFIITPRLVGNKVGLSALATILGLIIGGNLLGLGGMLIAIPLTAVLKNLVGELKKEYQSLDIYK